ncbi:PAP2 domain-containing protein, variant 2 [Coccidioides immitis RS]|uniref:PAP2 domain-containing protein, variant 2 n=3 Tax=Coccidioides immitis TaxID=5501 RepID=A0A0D8JV80_COCIM|nr:PAP2 domain-containing protein, variant 2 [Coccidioides immitis RS]KJF60168.1 PAP2 domain-containing protein, variant 2 [Coccidioides immitis RS]KMU81505.1 diacylglycerol pyrophosphate phosphatase [Coccidioides immitis RMSCC 3703]KMU83843.1 phosphatidic acid phosphatase type 2 domain-containing protein 1B [Coccidioides immitis H538.4]
MAQNDLPLHGNRKPSGISARPGCLGAVARFWYRSYAADYISLAIITAGWFIIQIFVEPFHRMFSLENGSIQFPFAVVERVPVDVVKNAVGRPRPDLISRCKPEKGTPAHTLVSFNVCLETDHHILHEGWRSFPSGHSSFAFGGLGYLSLFFAGQLHVFRPRSGLARFLFSGAPLLGALMIAMSRLADYRHDVYDVTVGSLLGLFTAYFTYRRYYPSLKSIDCDTPYSRPSGGYVAVSGVNRGLGDEEQPCNSPRPEYSGAEYQMQ